MSAFSRYEPAELDRQYNASATVPSVDAYSERFALASARVRGTLQCEIDVPYGSGPRQMLDLFPARRHDAPLFVFVHGGYWRRFDKSLFSFVAEPIVAAGGAAALVNYPLAPHATLDDIVASVRDAFVWIARNAAQRLSAEPARIVVGGHSAGGQLAGMLAATDWEARGLPREAVGGVFPISGLFELEPLRSTHINEWLKLDAESAARNSPPLPKRAIPLIGAVGANETDEFKRQTHDYARRWSAAGYPASEILAEGHNHFSVVFELADASSELSLALAELIAARA